MEPKAFIYDLDGVITDIAQYHYQSWKWVANELSYNLTEKQNQKLKGVGDYECLEKIISWSGQRISASEKQHILQKKNELFKSFIKNMSKSEIFEGFNIFNEKAKTSGIKVAVGCSSKNAITIIDKLDLVHSFQAIVDGNMSEKSKPHPEILLLVAEKLGVKPTDCFVFESSQAGIDAANAANMMPILYGSNPDIKGYKSNLISWRGASIDTFIPM